MVANVFSVVVIFVGFSVTIGGGMCVVMVILDVLCIVGATAEIMLGVTIVATFSVDEVIWGLEVDCVLVESSNLSV